MTSRLAASPKNQITNPFNNVQLRNLELWIKIKYFKF